MKTLYCICLTLLLASTSASAQIPNGSFESWTDGNPDGWVTTNFAGVAPITQSSTAADGQWSLKGEVLGVGPVAIPPIAGTGRMTTQEDALLGFPYSGRPEALNGFISTSLSGLDTANVIVAFRSGGDSIGVGFFRTGNDIPNLTAFSAPIYWLDSRTPDTAYVLVLIDGEPMPTLGSIFNIDGLTFGQAASVERDPTDEALEVVSLLGGGYEFRVANTSAVRTKLEILDIHGRSVETLLDGEIGETRIRWSGEGISAGIYLARVTTVEGLAVRKLVITK